MPDASILIGALFVPLFAAGASIWAWSFARLARGREILPYEPRRNVPWNGIDLLALVLTTFFLQGFATLLVATLQGIELANDRSNEADLVKLLGGAIGSLLAIVVIVTWLCRARGATASDLGLGGQLLKDSTVGLAGFAAASIVIYPLMLLLTQWIKYEHPIMTAVERHRSVEVLLITTVGAVVVAPVIEELLFRVLLQGWLEKKRRFWRVVQQIIPVLNRHNGPVLVSATAFGLAHYGQGPAPIPLFVLGLFLGYLYERTHRLLPCIVLHMCVNALTALQLWLDYFYPQPVG